ncbi:unnamed protein product [Paramecium sonneborni]|uniref:Uncharacterized protein n=1 Tax=Paramecium sonneborni TaxID=65129 RepID=A0A8S1N6A7_9CILI|nr:unnamed protein product [Paramecium sonneborni]
MKIINFISKLQKSIYLFLQLDCVIFVNVGRDENLYQKFYYVKQIFQFDKQQKEREIELIESQREIIRIQFRITRELFQLFWMIFLQQFRKQKIIGIIYLKLLVQRILNVLIWVTEKLIKLNKNKIGCLDRMVRMQIRQFRVIEEFVYVKNCQQGDHKLILDKFQKTLEEQREVYVLNFLSSKEGSFYFGLRKLVRRDFKLSCISQMKQSMKS